MRDDFFIALLQTLKNALFLGSFSSIFVALRCLLQQRRGHRHDFFSLLKKHFFSIIYMLLLHVLEHRHRRLHRVPTRASFFKSSTLHLRTLCFCQVRGYGCRVNNLSCSHTHIVFKSLASPPTCPHQGVRSRLCSLCAQPVFPGVRALAALQHLPYDVLCGTDPLLLPGVTART